MISSNKQKNLKIVDENPTEDDVTVEDVFNDVIIDDLIENEVSTEAPNRGCNEDAVGATLTTPPAASEDLPTSLLDKMTPESFEIGSDNSRKRCNKSEFFQPREQSSEDINDPFKDLDAKWIMKTK